jgi:phytanoyl-CoA hydroxylase
MSGNQPSSQLTSQYVQDGYVALPDLLTGSEVAQLREEAVAICRGDRGQVDGLVPVNGFAPANGLAPGHPGETDLDLIRRYLAIDNPHKLSRLMHRSLTHAGVVDVLTELIGPDVKAMQSMLFIKSQGRPGQAWHQDELFIPTRDRSLTAAWIALDDATVANGCLWVIPGSQRSGVLHQDRPQSDPRFDCSDEAFGFPYTDDDAVAVEVAAGSVVFFSGYLLHRSLPNGTNGLRRALVNHYMSAQSLLPWKALPVGCHIGEHDYRDIVIVAGTDPYHAKGTTDLCRPEIRPDGARGCGR